MTFPIASIEGNEIKISYTTKDYNHSQIDAEFKRELALINEYLGWLLKDIQRYNGILKSDIINTIESRKQKILKSREMVTALGYPIKRRTDIPKTYVVPVIRKTVIGQPLLFRVNYHLLRSLKLMLAYTMKYYQ